MQRGFHAVPTTRWIKNGNKEESSGPLVPVIFKGPQPLPSLLKNTKVSISRSSSVSKAGISEKLDQNFLNNATVVDPSITDIFSLEKAVLYRGVDDALLAVRYLNASGIQSIEIKYYNESSGLAHARPFLVDFQITDSAQGLFTQSLRRSPMVVGSNQYASLGVIYKEVVQPSINANPSSGLFSFFLLIDASISSTPVSARNNLDVFIANFENI